MALLSLKRGALLVLALAGGGCAFALDYNQCTVDTDCTGGGADGGALFCTIDHLCVDSLPAERLCFDHTGSEAPSALVMATLMAHGGGDLPLEQAVRLAVEEINALQGARMQSPLRVLFCDTAHDATQAMRAVRYAVETGGAQVLIGPTDEAVANALPDYLVAHGVLAISPSLTASSLATLPAHGLFYRTAPANALQALFLAEMAAKGHPTGVSVAYEDTEYGTDIGKGFFAAYTNPPVSGKNFLKSFPFRSMDESVKALLNLAADKPSDAIIVADTFAQLVVQQLLQVVEKSAMPFYYLTDSAKDPRIFGPQGQRLPATFLARFLIVGAEVAPGPASDGFKQRYTTRFQDDPLARPYIANAYDAVYLAAIAAAGTAGHPPTGRQLAAAIFDKVLFTGPALPVGIAKYLDALDAIGGGGGVRLVGASGPLEFDANGSLLRAFYETWYIDTTDPANPVFKLAQAML